MRSDQQGKCFIPMSNVAPKFQRRRRVTPALKDEVKEPSAVALSSSSAPAVTTSSSSAVASSSSSSSSSSTTTTTSTPAPIVVPPSIHYNELDVPPNTTVQTPSAAPLVGDSDEYFEAIADYAQERIPTELKVSDQHIDTVIAAILDQYDHICMGNLVNILWSVMTLVFQDSSLSKSPKVQKLVTLEIMKSLTVVAYRCCDAKSVPGELANYFKFSIHQFYDLLSPMMKSKSKMKKSQKLIQSHDTCKAKVAKSTPKVVHLAKPKAKSVTKSDVSRRKMAVSTKCTWSCC